MAYALVGTPGTLVTGATGASVSPAWGTGESRTANNLLILRVLSVAVNTLPAAPAGWSTGVQVQGTSCTSSIFYKIAAGTDAAPTVAGVASANLGAELSEFSGNASSAPLDQTASAAGTTSPLVATAAGADVAAGELVIYSAAVRLSAAATGNSAMTLNNGATAHDATNNNATSSSNHWETGYGITTGNASADSASFSYTTTNIVGAAVAVASFLLPAAAAASWVPSYVSPRTSFS